jgi:hypothetical protein
MRGGDDDGGASGQHPTHSMSHSAHAYTTFDLLRVALLPYTAARLRNLERGHKWRVRLDSATRRVAAPGRGVGV